jgi:RHS repeat-associated protein
MVDGPEAPERCRAASGNSSGAYAYNGDGLRTSRTIGGTTTTYVWDQNASMPAILRDSAGNRYVYGLDLISRTDNGGNQEYELSDGLGSTTGLADGTGAVTDTYTYDVYGAVRTRTGTSGNEFTFTGEQVDSSGLQYLRARYYDAATGRFASRDPLAARAAICVRRRESRELGGPDGPMQQVASERV